jgi:hypothetical protein
MITFLTLFLGLFTGTQTVELAVEPPVERVELLLDGERVGYDTHAPFRFQVDFGADPTPHRLTAVGLDAEGEEVARATRDLNLIPRAVGVEVALERAADGQPEAALLSWHSVDHSPPERLVFWLDGETLTEVDGFDAIPERVPLPALDLDDIHFVTAELYFPSGQVARAERVFGGELGREIDTDNTAVAVEVEGRRRLRRTEQAEGLVLVDGRPARVLAVEHGPAEVVIVRERSSRREMAMLTADMQIELFNPLIYGDWADDRLFFIGPAPRKLITAGARQALYPMSPAFPGARGNLIHWLVNEGYDPEAFSLQELPGAVAMAGMLAVTAARPRAVLLTIGPEAPPVEPGEGERVRRFLERLGVPLEIWYVQRDVSDLTRDERVAERRRRVEAVAAGEPPPPGRHENLERARRGWGEPVEDIGVVGDLTDATRALRDRIARQRILWIDGDHLPTEVSLAPGAPARLAGGAD